MLVSKGKLLLVLHPQPLVQNMGRREPVQCSPVLLILTAAVCTFMVSKFSSMMGHFFKISFYLFNKVTGSVIRVQWLSHTSGICLQQDLILSEPVTKNCALLNVPAASQQRTAAVGVQVAALNRRPGRKAGLGCTGASPCGGLCRP